MGCGAACVAFVARETYDDIAVMLGKREATTRGFRLRELIVALSNLGHSYNAHRTDGTWRKALNRDGTIVFIERSARYPFGHYLVRYDNKWMDPWVNLVVNRDIRHAKSGFRRRLPGRAQWILTPAHHETKRTLARELLPTPSERLIESNADTGLTHL